MCLYIKKGQRVKIAKEDIECYKIVWYENEKYKSYYRHEDVDLGETYESKIERDGEVIEKALHSLTSLINALKFLSQRTYNPKNVKIVKCTIPKGSRYYIGFFDNENDSYASNAIIYSNKIIKYSRNSMNKALHKNEL